MQPMDRDVLEMHLMAQPGAELTHPFGPDADVYKVNARIFAIVSRDEAPMRISLKCDPDLAEALRSSHAAVTPGYHLSKRHWNTVALDGSVPDDEVLGMIDHSYELVARQRRR
jgi:predicted DNA-binding protein (MmcQ/YjbR family)